MRSSADQGTMDHTSSIQEFTLKTLDVSKLKQNKKFHQKSYSISETHQSGDAPMVNASKMIYNGSKVKPVSIFNQKNSTTSVTPLKALIRHEIFRKNE